MTPYRDREIACIYPIIPHFIRTNQTIVMAQFVDMIPLQTTFLSPRLRLNFVSSTNGINSTLLKLYPTESYSISKVKTYRFKGTAHEAGKPPAEEARTHAQIRGQILLNRSLDKRKNKSALLFCCRVGPKLPILRFWRIFRCQQTLKLRILHIAGNACRTPPGRLMNRIFFLGDLTDILQM